MEKADENTSQIELRSESERTVTSKMTDYMENESPKRLSQFTKTYEQWKNLLKECRVKLKEGCEEGELGCMVDTLRRYEENVLQTFDRFKYCCIVPPDANIVRKVDACVELTKMQ